MARTPITVQQPGLAGATPTYPAPDSANGNYFAWAGYPVLIHAKNTNAATRTMTIAAGVARIGGLAPTAPTLLLPATTGDKMLAIVDASGLVQSDGTINLDWTADTGVTVAIVRLQ